MQIVLLCVAGLEINYYLLLLFIKRTVSCILINRKAPIFHCVLINLSFSMFVKAEIRQKLNNGPKTKGH